MQVAVCTWQRLLLILLLSAASNARSSGQGGARRLASTPKAGVGNAGATVSNKTGDYVTKVLERYLTNAELAAALKDYAVRCGAIAKLSSIGQSVKGDPLWALEVSNKPGQKEAEPNFKYVGNIHGDEASPRQMLLALAEWLCANYKSDPRASRIVNDMHLYILPSMNPDGYALGQRGNAKGLDLNRNFPDPIMDKSLAASPSTQPEVRAVMDWTLKKDFTASASFHEGTWVVNYPWDGNVIGWAAYNATPDDDTMRHLATLYASNNPGMMTSEEFPGGPGQPPGTTNGAAWYTIYGGSQDWNYAAAGCLEMTVEVWGPAEAIGRAPLQAVWEQNKDSLLEYALHSALGGVRGRVRVRNAAGRLRAAAADITVNGSSTVTRSLRQRFGFYSRPLRPGQHSVRYSLSGYPAQEHTVWVPEGGGGVVKDVVFG